MGWNKGRSCRLFSNPMNAPSCSETCDCTAAAPVTGTEARHDKIQHVLEHAAHCLPSQGPMGVFVHHNTLHAFQHQDFEKSVIEAAQLFEAEPFLSEEDYQQARLAGRILDEDIDAAEQPTFALNEPEAFIR